MRKPIILIFGIDDILRQNLKRRLTNQGFVVNEAPEHGSVSGLCNSMDPDLVIVCSTGKSLGDKLGIIKNIRRFNKVIPIVLITWFSSELRAIAALRAGADDYFKLPLSTQKVVQRVSQLISNTGFEHAIGNTSNMTDPSIKQ
ncbi:MAG: response regulator, partial [Desulfobacterales bacterium]